MQYMNPVEPGSDILARLRRRDESALPALLALYGSRVASTVRGTWRGIPDSDVEEVLADVLVDAWFRISEVTGARGSLEVWLVMRARYRTLDRLRKARRGRALVTRISRFWQSNSSKVEYPSDLDAYLAGLSELDRGLVHLRFLEGRPVAEVASTCGLTQKAVERRLARLRDRLRERSFRANGIGESTHA
jgi:RNA polymerase sigma factor (sigma-70 family)